MGVARLVSGGCIGFGDRSHVQADAVAIFDQPVSALPGGHQAAQQIASGGVLAF